MTALHIIEDLSPNCGPRRDGLEPYLIVLHYTAMKSAAAAKARLCDPVAEVSAHYLIAADGTVTRLVQEEQRAWHAGAGEWHGRSDINSRSVGIELDNRGTHPFAEPQMAALEHLLKDLMARWQIAPDGVIGHSDMAPGRKTDPGAHFDWARLARQGLAARTGTGAPGELPDMVTFRKAAIGAGYTGDVPDEVLLRTVRLRHRPFATGALQPADIAALSP